jgi:regulatory protein
VLRPAPTVTALRELRGGKVAVALDGAEWRRLPVDVVVRAGLHVGAVVDRSCARDLARELRRDRALAVAARALRHRDLARAEVERRLERPGIGPAARAEAVSALERAGMVDDSRFAASRATALADRGYGDAAIGADLDRRGVGTEAVREALALLEPESERAWRVVARGVEARAAARRLAARGFAPETVEAVLDALVANEPPRE